MTRQDRMWEELLSAGRRLDPDAPGFDQEAAEAVNPETRTWATGKLARILVLVEDGLLEDMEIGADELATCTNEQKLASRLRTHAGNLRSILGGDAEER